MAEFMLIVPEVYFHVAIVEAASRDDAEKMILDGEVDTNMWAYDDVPNVAASYIEKMTNDELAQGESTIHLVEVEREDDGDYKEVEEDD